MRDSVSSEAFTTSLIQSQMTRLALVSSGLQSEMAQSSQVDWVHTEMLSTKLDQWYEDIPPALHIAALGASNKVMTDVQKRAIYMMHTLYIDSRLQLYCRLFKASQVSQRDSDPFLLETLLKRTPLHFSKLHADYANTLARILSLMFDEGNLMTRSWLIMYHSCPVFLSKTDIVRPAAPHLTQASFSSSLSASNTLPAQPATSQASSAASTHVSGSCSSAGTATSPQNG